MHEIKFGYNKYYIPEKLSECNPKQLIDVCTYLYLLQTNQINYEDFRIDVLCKLLNVDYKKIYSEDALANIYILSSLIDSFFQDTEEGKELILDFYDNPLATYRPRVTKYYGFNNLFQNCTFAEYLDAYRTFCQFSATPTNELLQELSAILYRGKQKYIFFKKLFGSYNYQIREKYIAAAIPNRTKKFKNYPIGFLYANYLIFNSFQKTLTTAQIPWAGKIIDFSILYNNTDASTTLHPTLGMDSHLFTLAEAGTFGNKEQLAQTPAWEVFVKMYDAQAKYLNEKDNKPNDTNQ